MNETVVPDQTKRSLFKDRPVTLVVAAVLLLLLILVYAVLPLTGLERVLLRGGVQRASRGQFQGNFNLDDLPGGQNFTPGNLPQGQNFDQSNPGTNPDFTGPRQFNANSGLNAVLRILTNVLYWTVTALGFLAIVGLWLKKRWGILLAVFLAVVAFAFTVTSMFRPMLNAFTIATNVSTLLLSVGVVVMSLLPQTRKATVAV